MFAQRIVSNLVNKKFFVHQPLINYGCKNIPKRNRRVFEIKANVNNVTKTTYMTSQQALENLIESKDLSQKDVCHVIDELLEINDPIRIGAFLVLLSVKGETADEIAGLAESMKRNAIKVELPYDVVDIVGTGGDGVGSINISTGATIIAAAAGAKIAKHGNRSVSSLCGSADVLEELGVFIELPPEGVKYCIDKCGISFMFAPIYHPIMSRIKKVRNSLKLKTVFNILGPLLNPSEAKYSLIGVYKKDLMKLMAETIKKLGIKKAYIVHSMGMDELTPIGLANILEVTNKSTKSYIMDPKDYDIPKCDLEDLKGGDRRTNAQMLLDVFSGCKGHVSDAINLNAGFALAACKIAKNPKEGVALAKEVQRSGKAGDKLKEWVQASEEAKNLNNDTIS